MADVVKKQAIVDSCHDWADDEQIHLDTEDCLRGLADALEAESARADELAESERDRLREVNRELLSACEEVWLFIDDGAHTAKQRRLLDQLRAVIAKAKGETT